MPASLNGTTTLSIYDTQYSDSQHDNNKCDIVHNIMLRIDVLSVVILSIVKGSAFKLIVVMLSVIMLSVVMLSVIMLNVEALLLSPESFSFC